MESNKGICLIYTALIIFFAQQITFANELSNTQLDTTQLQKQLFEAVKNKGANYKPRTKHFDKNGQPQYTNRLILEDSPYLLQHAHNPVDWYSWGDEAFARAREENKPVFLSIGYSTCHWCHVMEKESFEDIEIARYLNEHFISIKVDRERRPDVDELYMTALMLIKGQGGWPMSSFLLSDGLPFFAGTYFPPDIFLNLLNEISQAWDKQQDEINEYARNLKKAVQQTMQVHSDIKAFDDDIAQRAVTEILQAYDNTHGGFGGSPKFPNESLLLLLLQMSLRQHHEEAIAAIEHTLTMMARGGIYDQVGGGFHRYATDASWLVPHFEKMLYNQANLARVYIQAYQLTGNLFYARVASNTLDYVLRDMSTSEGVFYSASDADSNGHEGVYFLWTPEELKKILSADDAQFIMKIYNITEEGNFEGGNILYLPLALDEIAQQQDTSIETLLTKLDGIHEILRTTRNQRVPPLRDEKIIVAWNAMMISALAEVAKILNKPEYLMSATRTAEFLWAHQRKSDGSLWRVNLQGRTSITATQEDYAYFIDAMITLYDVSDDRQWLDRAQELSGVMSSKFWDVETGGFIMSENKQSLFTVPKQSRDSAIPSGNSVAVHVLTRLSQRIFDRRYEEQAKRTVQTFAKTIHQYPSAYAYMLAGWDKLLHGSVGPDEYAANGAIKVSAQLSSVDKEKSVLITMKIGPDWHINTNQPLQDYLIPLKLNLVNDQSHWQLQNIKYPDPIYKVLEFDGGKLALYEGTVKIDAELVSSSKPKNLEDKRIDIQLQLQACSNEICLPPEKVNLELTTH
jgi:uncharacterized protein YyaL (SSP411 family)